MIEKLQRDHDVFADGVKIDGKTMAEVTLIVAEKLEHLELLKLEMKIELKRLQRQHFETVKDVEQFQEMYERLSTKI